MKKAFLISQRYNLLLFVALLVGLAADTVQADVTVSNILEIREPLIKPLASKQLGQAEPRVQIEHDGTYIINLGVALSFLRLKLAPHHAVQWSFYGVTVPSLLLKQNDNANFSSGLMQ